jgi:molecular chaperone DnaK
VDKALANDLLMNLLERATTATDKTFLTTREIEALATLLDAKIVPPGVVGDEKFTSPGQPRVLIGISSINVEEVDDDIMVCVDFGTSFSKAFASIQKGTDRPELIDLPIGDGSTGSTLTTPSELMIDEGRIYFGTYARKQLDDTQASPDRLIDSIKQFITLNSDISLLDKIKTDISQDPTQSFSRRDILVLYLSHLMRLTETALAAKGLTANVRRRFAHPAWKTASKEKNENEMRIMMAEAIILARSVGDSLTQSIPVADARALLDQLKGLNKESLPLNLIHDPVREATAAGAGALLATAEDRREIYLIVDIGAGTTDVAGFICVNNTNWDRSRLFEITGAADAKNMAGNVLDTALQKFILEKSALVSDSEEYRAAAMSVRRDRRVLKEQLFNSGEVIVPLPTDENVMVTLEEFQAYAPVVTFSRQIREMVSKSAAVVSGDASRINLVATGGGAALPIIKELADEGVTFEGSISR